MKTIIELPFLYNFFWE